MDTKKIEKLNYYTNKKLYILINKYKKKKKILRNILNLKRLKKLFGKIFQIWRINNNLILKILKQNKFKKLKYLFKKNIKNW